MCMYKIHKQKVWKHVFQIEKVSSFGRGGAEETGDLVGEGFKRNFYEQCVHFFNINVFMCHL